MGKCDLNEKAHTECGCAGKKEECLRTTPTCVFRGPLQAHEATAHGHHAGNKYTCYFCGEKIAEDKGKDYEYSFMMHVPSLMADECIEVCQQCHDEMEIVNR